MMIFVKDCHNIKVGLTDIRREFEKKHGLRPSNGDLLAMLVKQELARIEAERPKMPIGYHGEDYSQMGPDHF